MNMDVQTLNRLVWELLAEAGITDPPEEDEDRVRAALTAGREFVVAPLKDGLGIFRATWQDILDGDARTDPEVEEHIADEGAYTDFTPKFYDPKD